MAEYDNTDKGALWKKQDKNGNGFLGGTVNVGGKEFFLNVFKNNYKEEGDNKPDYNVTVTAKEEQKKPAPKTQEEDDLF